METTLETLLSDVEHDIIEIDHPAILVNFLISLEKSMIHVQHIIVEQKTLWQQLNKYKSLIEQKLEKYT
jgi:hypothetical protein